MGLKDQEIKMVKIENLTASDPLTFDLYVESPDFLNADSQFIFTGTSHSGQIALYSYDIEEEPENYIWPNIEIVDFNVSNIEYEYDPNDPIAEAFKYDTEMTIYNNSDDIIESFAVFTYLLIGVEGQPFFYNIFTDHTINPFEEITFSLPRMIKYDRPSHNNEFCFEILAPNSKIEPNISKNILCKTFNIVGVDDFHPENSFIIYPNPASNKVTIMNLNEPAHFRIFNIFGQVKSIGALDQNYEINLNNLSNGVYFIELNYNNQRTILKVLKE
jgi:hypothetical protein